MVLTLNSTATSSIYLFSTPEGLALCRQLISAKLQYDPHDYQLEGVCKALDGIDVLAVTPTGSGKTGFLTMYLLVMHAIMNDPSLCAPKKPPVRFRKDGAMVVVCPTKSLEVDMEPKFVHAGLRTLVINKDTADKERRINGADIWHRAPDQHVLLLAPEQLSTKGFEHLLDNKPFQHRVVALGVDEAHLLVTWGKSFREDFKAIGPARVRFDLPPVLLVLTATLRVGAHCRSVCTFLGLRPGHFHFIRRSNMRYDIRFLFRTVQSSAQALMFPELDWLLSEKRRVIVFCCTIAISFRVAKYLMARAELSHCTDYGTLDERIRMYTALNWDSYNEETLTTVHSGATSWVVIATDTLSVGVDISGTQDVVLYDFGLPIDSDAILQKAGRIRDGKGEGSRFIIYLPRNAMEVCERALSQAAETASEEFMVGGTAGTVAHAVDISTARLVVASCKVKEINALYANPEQDTPCKCKSCSARSPLPKPVLCNCSGCMPESAVPLPDAAPSGPHAAPPPTPKRVQVPADQKITKKMRSHAQARFYKFRRVLRERSDPCLADLLPAEEFLPDTLIKAALDSFYDIVDVETLKQVTSNYIHLRDCWPSLLQVVETIRQDFEEMRATAKAEAAEKSRATRAQKKADKEALLTAALELAEAGSSDESGSAGHDSGATGSGSECSSSQAEESDRDSSSDNVILPTHWDKSLEVRPKIVIPGGQSVRFQSRGGAIGVQSLEESHIDMLQPELTSRLTITIPSRSNT